LRILTLDELARLLGGEVAGDGSIRLTGMRPLELAGPEHAGFLANPRYSGQLLATRAGAVIAGPGVEAPGRNLLIVADPYLAFARAMEEFHREPFRPLGVHPRAEVHPSARLGAEPSLHPFAVAGEGAVLGDRVTLMAGAVVGAGAEVGDDTVLHPHAVLEKGCRVGRRCIVHAGSVIGSDGFGFAPEGKRYRKIPQAGIVRVGDDVEIGANCAIDRATMGETVIGSGSKLDNLVHVAHNVVIGENCILTGQTGIAGSATLGDHVTIAGQSGVAGHLSVGAGAVVAAKSAVFKDVPPGATVAGIPAGELSEWRRNAGAFSRLDLLRKRVARLESELSLVRGRGKTDVEGE
jgi:UDP-3-O-[3-hydroxymyristoyl] glucosamine N-acyltransferase